MLNERNLDLSILIEFYYSIFFFFSEIKLLKALNKINKVKKYFNKIIYQILKIEKINLLSLY